MRSTRKEIMQQQKKLRYTLATTQDGKYCMTDTKYGVRCVFTPHCFNTEEIEKQNRAYFSKQTATRKKTIIQGMRRFLVENHYDEAFCRYSLNQRHSNDEYDITHIEYLVVDRLYQIECSFIAYRFHETKQIQCLDSNLIRDLSAQALREIIESLETYVRGRLYILSGAESRYALTKINGLWQLFDQKYKVVICFEEKRFYDTYEIKCWNETLFCKAFFPNDVDRLMDEATQYLKRHYRKLLQ